MNISLKFVIKLYLFHIQFVIEWTIETLHATYYILPKSDKTYANIEKHKLRNQIIFILTKSLDPHYYATTGKIFMGIRAIVTRHSPTFICVDINWYLLNSQHKKIEEVHHRELQLLLQPLLHPQPILEVRIFLQQPIHK